MGDELALGAVGLLGDVARRGEFELDLLALGDVGVGAHPLAHRFVVVRDRHGAHQHVAPGAVVSTQTMFGLEDRPRLERASPEFERRLPVVGMHGVEPTAVARLRRGLTREPVPVGLGRLEPTGGTGRPDDRDRRADEGPEAFLAPREAELGPLAERVVDDDEPHALGLAVRRRLDRVEAHQEMPRGGPRVAGRDLGLEVRVGPPFAQHAGELRLELPTRAGEHGPEVGADVGPEDAVAEHGQGPVHVPDLERTVEEAEADRRVLHHAVEERAGALTFAPPHRRLPREEQRRSESQSQRGDREEEGLGGAALVDVREIAPRIGFDGRRLLARPVHDGLAGRQTLGQGRDRDAGASTNDVVFGGDAFGGDGRRDLGEAARGSARRLECLVEFGQVRRDRVDGGSIGLEETVVADEHVPARARLEILQGREEAFRGPDDARLGGGAVPGGRPVTVVPDGRDEGDDEQRDGADGPRVGRVRAASWCRLVHASLHIRRRVGLTRPEPRWLRIHGSSVDIDGTAQLGSALQARCMASRDEAHHDG